MKLFINIVEFIVYSLIIVYISKNILVKLLRKIAELLDLSPKAVGNIAGFATSMPELLTVFFSSVQGLFGTGIYNIISSNVINVIQYAGSILLNKNEKYLKNKALKIELVMVAVTIAIPLFMVINRIDANITIVPIFILLFIMMYYLKGNAYKVYKVQEVSDNETRKINEAIIGLILGIITSIPELITFIEAQKYHGKSSSNMQGVVEATSNLFTSNMINLFAIESVGIIVFMLFS